MNLVRDYLYKILFINYLCKFVIYILDMLILFYFFGVDFKVLVVILKVYVYINKEIILYVVSYFV